MPHRSIPDLHSFVVLFALAMLLTGCASTPKDAAGTSGVRIISETAIEPSDGGGPDGEPSSGDGATPELWNGDRPEAEAQAFAADFADPESAAAEDLGEPNDAGATTREALAKAIEWTTEGLRLYETGHHDDARQSLSDARIVLLHQAELPEVMKERGLSAIHCALAEDLRHHDPEAVLTELELEAQASGPSENAERAFVEREVRRLLRRFGAPTPDEAYLAVFVDEVARYIRFYQGKYREFFEPAFERKHKYWPTIEEVFHAKGIPIELGYMALVESGFKPRAKSHADARGLWQFISGTGRRYGLRRIDDFYDVRKATEAASEYLLDLIGIFGSRSFLLATAAYNAGENRVQRCLKELDDPFGKRSFWEIRGCLARETQEYVPRIMAAVVIGSDPKRFGFDVATRSEMLLRYDVVTIPSPTSLSTLAARAGVSVADLRTANTDLRSNATVTSARNFPLYVPKGGGESLRASLRAAPPSSVADPAPRVAKARSSPAPREITGAPFEYTARSGDTLQGIAQGFEVSVADLKEWNPFLRQRVLYRGDRLKVYPGPGARARKTVYTVRRGDTLSEIADRHGVAYRELASWNQLRSPYRLSVGQKLEIYPGESAPQGIVYTVRSGNTLRTIANIFSVRYRDIMKWNNLKSSTLRVGQELLIHPSRPVRVERYRVQSGDTIGKIARRFGVTIESMLTANGLRSRSLIRPGQRLTIYQFT